MPDLCRELHSGLVRILQCPVCGGSMRVSDSGGSLVCDAAVTERNPKGRTHCFDGAASGYVPLSPHHGGGGDAKDAVRARTAFLTHGYYAPAAEALVCAVRDYTPEGGMVLDAGCGEGYYSNHVAAAGFPVLGVDLSKFAVEAAAKSARRANNTGDPRTLFAVGSVFALPVADRTVDTVLNIFAPCAPREYARVLKSNGNGNGHTGGHLIVAGAGERHLFGLKELLYDDPYLNDPRRDLPAEADGLHLLETRHVTFSITVEDPAHIAALFSMTPYYWRTPRESRDRIDRAGRLETEVAFDIHIYKKY